MKFPLLAAVLLILAIPPGLVIAQKDPSVKTIAFDPNKGYRHGQVLQFNYEGKQVKGILVRADGNNIYIRESPGALPKPYPRPKDVKLAVDDGKGIKDVMLVVADDGKGGVRDVTYPEIQQITIINGRKSSVSYLAPTLSPGERSHLVHLEAAENEAARLENLSSIEHRVLETDLAIQSAQLEAEQLRNLALWQRGPGGYSNLQPATVPFGPSWYGQPLFYVPSFGMYYGGYSYGSFNYQPDGLLNSGLPYQPTIVRQGPSVFPGLPVAPDALVKAQQNLTLARNNTVFDQGQVVAVIVPDQPPPPLPMGK